MSTDGTVRAATDIELNRLLAELLGVQQRLATPVTRASAAYDARSSRSTAPAQDSAFHRDLIPLSAPGPGEQYAFEIDLDACSGCKACVAACHALNGLDETEAWRDVGLLVSSAGAPWQQTVTTACHHCSEPGCLEGCPVVAYEKDPLTGIVRHLDDQCIGCSYCILKCPYDVPKFNARLGIVRKCDMCHQRLAVGEAPACAQACPTQAIRIVNVAVEHVSPKPDYRVAAPRVFRPPFREFSSLADAKFVPPAEHANHPSCERGQFCGCNSERKSSSGAVPNGAAVRESNDPPIHATPQMHSASSAVTVHSGSLPARLNGAPQVRIGASLAETHRSSAATGKGVVQQAPAIEAPAIRLHHHGSCPNAFLPAAPDPSYTKPTTRYVSARGLPPHVRAADADTLRLQPAHGPLVAMLVLTQLALGLLVAAPLTPLSAAYPTGTISAAARYPLGNFPSATLDHVNCWLTHAGSLPLHKLVDHYAKQPAAHGPLFGGLALLFAGLGASVLHLGRPLRAWRFFLGLRTSWLSREILAFNLLVPLACATLLWPASVPLRLAIVSASAGAVFCSAMIYIDTRRRFWRAPSTALRFFGCTVVAALALTQPCFAAVALGIKLLAEASQTRGSGISARLQRGPLRTTLFVRFALGIAAVATFVAAPGWGAFALFAAGELAERILFFRSVDAPKMPGNPVPA